MASIRYQPRRLDVQGDEDDRNLGFALLKEAIESKVWTPLMEKGDIEEAERQIAIQTSKTYPAAMTTAKTLFIVNHTVKQVVGVIHKRAAFNSARYNDATSTQINAMLPKNLGDKKKASMELIIKRHVDVDRKQALGWVFTAIRKIRKTADAYLNESGWGRNLDIFKSLEASQRKEILGAIFEQYPLWLMNSGFRQREAKYVDFDQIWCPINSPDRIPLREFYRWMFIEMGEEMFQCRIIRKLGEDSSDMLKAWKEFPNSAAVLALGLGGGENLPIR